MSDRLTLRARATRYLKDAARGIRRAPVEVAATLLIAFAFSYSIEAGGDTMATWFELAAVCVLVIAVAWTGTLLHAFDAWGATRRWAVTITGAAVIAAYGLFVVDFDYGAERWRAFLLLVAALAWVIVVPALVQPRASAVARMRRVDGRILLRALGAGLYGIALFAGLALALRAIDVLFQLELRGEIYGHVWGWISFVLVPWVVLGGLPDYVRPIEQASAVAGVAQRITLFLVPPLLAVYYVILYAYVVRILITQEIPNNLVSPLVLAAGGLAALALLLFDPRPDARGIGRALRIAPALFLPLVPLGLWALLQRTNQYGLTEFRLVRLIALGVLALLAAGATVQLMRRRAFTLPAVPLAFACATFLAAFGPWSVLSLSRHSQQTRLADGLAQLGVPAQDSTWQAQDSMPRTVPAHAYQQIRGSARYLAANFGADALPPVLAHHARDSDRDWRDYARDLNLQPDAPTTTDMVVWWGTLPLNEPLPLLDGSTAWRVEWSPPPGAAAGPTNAPQSAGAVRIEARDSLRLRFSVDDRRVETELSTVIAALPREALRRPGTTGLDAHQALVPVTDSTGVRQGQLMIWHIMARTDSIGTSIARLEGLLILNTAPDSDP